MTTASSPTALDHFTLVVAIAGFLVAGASLTWQVASWRLSGPRVTVGAMKMTGRPGNHQLVVLTVRNVGRMPASIVSVGLRDARRRRPWRRYRAGLLVNRTINADVPPATIPPGVEVTYVVDRSDMVKAAAAEGPGVRAWTGMVGLPVGRWRTHGKPLKL